jgi:hypothetical protein
MIPPVGPHRLAAGLSVAVGVALAVFVALRAGDLPLPAVLTLFFAAALEIVLGVGLARRDRVAWAFSVALAGVQAVALLLAVPAMVRGGIHVGVAATAVAAVGAQLTLLIVGRSDFSA